nr:hypothetical protein BdHM001_30470 [Bdellovibrio sp. HM001]
MKSTGMKILFSALVLTLAACSGGGGGGGGGSNSGDVANDSPTITNPPTAAKGTPEEMTALVQAVGGGTPDAVIEDLFSVFGSVPKNFAKGKAEPMDPCVSEDGADSPDADEDGFPKYYRFKSTNCQETFEYEGQSFTQTYSDDLIIKDEDDENEDSNASLTSTGSRSWKNAVSKAEVAADYSAASLVYVGASGLLKLNYKTGGYDSMTTPEQPQGYMALWLSVQFGPAPLINIGASVTGFVQFYVQNSGMVTVTVTSEPDYLLNETSRCLEGGKLVLKYADGSNVLEEPLAQPICLDAFSK